jgi:ribosomal protein S18 acetylase RimI-like enzyme
MEIRTLKDCDPDDLVNAFNESFSGYFVPLQVTREPLINKIKSEKVDLDYSTGAFKDGKLSAFILHGYDIISNKKIIYNAGTGVVPGQRNQGLAKRMYDFIMPSLMVENINALVLEVITANIPAIKSYGKVGFKEKRKLLSYRGEVNTVTNEAVAIKELFSCDWEKLKTFWDFPPAWQNSINVLERGKDNLISYGAFIDEQLAGYIVYNPAIRRVQQFAVDRKYRRKKIASTLFFHIRQPGSSITVINVDESSLATNAFLKEIGLLNFIEQIEMQLDLC